MKGVRFEEPEYRPLATSVQEVEPPARGETPAGFILDEAPFYKEGDSPMSDSAEVV